MIAIIDYGMGNLRSVEKAFEKVGAECVVTSVGEVVSSADKIVLPGVGAFGDAMEELAKRNLIEVIEKSIKTGKLYLGICLGLQLLFEQSREGGVEGLGIFKGRVRNFSSSVGKIPHMGWNQIEGRGESGKCPLLKNINDGSYFYFCHSYYVKPDNDDIIAAVTDYGDEFTSMIWRDNVYAAQFHPEKSQGAGLRMLRNFAECAVK